MLALGNGLVFAHVSDSQATLPLSWFIVLNMSAVGSSASTIPPLFNALGTCDRVADWRDSGFERWADKRSGEHGHVERVTGTRLADQSALGLPRGGERRAARERECEAEGRKVVGVYHTVVIHVATNLGRNPQILSLIHI